MNPSTEQNSALRTAILIININALLGAFPLTIATLNYLISNNLILIILLFPTLIISTILIILRIRIGYWLTLLASLLYAFIFSNKVARYLGIDFQYLDLLFLLIPYLTYLSLIFLTTTYLTTTSKKSKILNWISVIVIIGFLIYPVIWNKMEIFNFFSLKINM